MTGAEHLMVSLHGRPVGVLSRRERRSSFVLLDDYLASYPRPVLGQVFEENPRGQFVAKGGIPAWFQNLLPEQGPLRSFLIRELGVPDDDFMLAAALGADLPGAITITESVGGPMPAGTRRVLESPSARLSPLYDVVSTVV